jgi:hypothetical protein
MKKGGFAGFGPADRNDMRNLGIRQKSIGQTLPLRGRETP